MYYTNTSKCRTVGRVKNGLALKTKKAGREAGSHHCGRQEAGRTSFCGKDGSGVGLRGKTRQNAFLGKTGKGRGCEVEKVDGFAVSDVPKKIAVNKK